MRPLHRKLIRDLGLMKGQALAIGMVMACGVATFVMSVSMLDSLGGTLDRYYQSNRFGEVFAHLMRAPLTVSDEIAAIPGVSHVQTRVVERITLNMPGQSEPASGRIVSIPDREGDGLNLLHLRAGRYPERRNAREVLVSQRFAEAHDLLPGSTVSAILNGRLQSLRVVGVALSPEYIYLISPGSVLPDNERFGVFWMKRAEMEAAFDMEGAFNDVVLTLTPRANPAEVIVRLDDLTEPYGGLGAYARSDQISHMFMENELAELRGMTLMVPIVFLGVAAFLLNIVLSRLIATQREQIAALKALGYSTLEIGLHYAGFALVITTLAMLLGSTAGAWMGRGMTSIYIEFFDFPSFEYTLRSGVVVLALVVSMLAAIVGVVNAVRSAMRLPPAEAMRPKAPPSFRPTFLEDLGLHRVVPPAVRMILRQLERRPLKTMLSVLGISLATAILVLGSFTEDAIDYLLDFQFNQVLRYDVDVVFADHTDDSAVSTLRHMPGVRSSEPYRTIAARIRRDHRDRRIGILGLTTAHGLHRLLDMSGRPVILPERGIVLSSVLADLLAVEIGEDVSIEALEGRRPTFSVEVTGIIEDFSGLSAYMSLHEMNRLMSEQDTMGGAYLDVDAAFIDELYEDLRATPHVAAVNVKSATVRNFRETIERNVALMRPFMVGFSIIIAIGVVYNSARVSLSERSRDLATLRVIGFTVREISVIQLGELALVTGFGIPAGLGIGFLLAWVTSVSVDSELIRIPFVINVSTFAFAALVTALAALGSALVVRRRLDALDLISVLKSRE